MNKTLKDFKYEELADKSIEELKTLQGELAKKYNINWYENWFYNDTTQLFTLSSDEKEVNFRYLNVGTYSRNTNTWKWSWDHDHTEDYSKQMLESVRVYGLKNEFEKLTTGYLPATENEAWEFTAITAKLLSAVGAYRAVSDHLLIFMVLTEHVPNEQAHKIKDAFVDCDDHGSSRLAFVCKHLNKTKRTGFNESFESDPTMELDLEDAFQAWCDNCELERLKTDGWNDESMKFADIKLICNECYFELKKFNLEP